MGDPAGVGPAITWKAYEAFRARSRRFFVIADLAAEAIRLGTTIYCEVGGDLSVQGIVPHPWRSALDRLGRE